MPGTESPLGPIGPCCRKEKRIIKTISRRFERCTLMTLLVVAAAVTAVNDASTPVYLQVNPSDPDRLWIPFRPETFHQHVLITLSLHKRRLFPPPPIVDRFIETRRTKYLHLHLMDNKNEFVK